MALSAVGEAEDYERMNDEFAKIELASRYSRDERSLSEVYTKSCKKPQKTIYLPNVKKFYKKKCHFLHKRKL